jgi:hypothetical protein
LHEPRSGLLRLLKDPLLDLLLCYREWPAARVNEMVGRSRNHRTERHLKKLRHELRGSPLLPGG